MSTPPESTSPPTTQSTKRRRRLKLITRRAVKRLAILALILAIVAIVAWWNLIRMPGSSYRGPVPALTTAQVQLRDELRADVKHLAGPLAGRGVWAKQRYDQAAAFLFNSLTEAGLQPTLESFDAIRPAATCANIIAEIPGITSPSEIIIIGAHYDTASGQPGADDNASGVAATLALARYFATRPQARNLRFVLFANEEPPYFQTEGMGSLIHARGCEARNENIVAMISLEMLGYFDDSPNSQRFPPGLSLFYPDRGNFIAFVSNVGSRTTLKRSIAEFREHATIPSEGAALPESFAGVGFSDHWAFWQTGRDAFMVTDTAMFRNPHYHQSTDTPATLDFDRMTLVVDGLKQVVKDLASR